MSDDEQISIYDEVEIEDMTYDETLQLYHYPCPCGDRFEIALHDLMDGEDIGVCPSCSLMIRVIFEVVSRCLSFCLGKAREGGGVGALVP
jgi:diphthamide biosynthesis protein 3